MSQRALIDKLTASDCVVELQSIRGHLCYV